MAEIYRRQGGENPILIGEAYNLGRAIAQTAKLFAETKRLDLSRPNIFAAFLNGFNSEIQPAPAPLDPRPDPRFPPIKNKLF